MIEDRDLSQDPDMIQDRDMMDMIIDPNSTDSSLLEGKESQTGIIVCKPNEDLHILCDVLGVNVRISTTIRRPWTKLRN